MIGQHPAAALRRAFRSERRLLEIFGLALAAALALRPGYIADYVWDAKPTVDALASGDVVRALTEHQPAMGPLTIFLRAPFVAIARAFGAGDLATYRVGVFACVACTALLVTTLVRWFRSQTQSRSLGLLVVMLAIAAPAALTAMELGHPEELLGAALCAAAVAAGIRGRPVAATLLLGLALATKQWAVLAIGPTLLAVGRTYFWRVAAVASGIAGVLMLPQLLADHEGVASMTRVASLAPTHPFVLSWWYVLTPEIPIRIASLTHPAIVFAAIPLTALAYKRRADVSSSVLPLLALLFLIRCVLDPQDNYYYHLPLLFALLAWDLEMRRRMPYATLAVMAALVVTTSYLSSNYFIASSFYLAWTFPLGVYLVVTVLRGRRTEAAVPAQAPAPGPPERVLHANAAASIPRI